MRNDTVNNRSIGQTDRIADESWIAAISQLQPRSPRDWDDSLTQTQLGERGQGAESTLEHWRSAHQHTVIIRSLQRTTGHSRSLTGS